MSPGPIEEGAKVASGVVEGLKSQPHILALIVVNLLFLAFIVWVLSEVSAGNRARDAQTQKMFTELQESLRVCRQLIPTTQFRLQGEGEPVPLPPLKPLEEAPP